MIGALSALAEPTRLRIVDLLRAGEHAVGDVARELELRQPNASKHLKALEEAGLVRVRRDAQRRLYRLSPSPFVQFDAWLASYRHLWTARLDDLERHLDRSSAERAKRAATSDAVSAGRTARRTPSASKRRKGTP